MDVIQLRRAVFRRVNKSPRRKRVFAQCLAVHFRRNGANSAIVDEAVTNAGSRSSKRTSEMMMWAAAVEGRSHFPQYFPATTYIKSAAAKEASANGLARYIEATPDVNPELLRFFYTFRPEGDLGEIAEFVAGDLERRFQERATRPPSRIASRDEQVTILREVTKALEASGLRPFLVSGTLLGLVRDQELMPHDYDIDLGLLPGAGTADDVVRSVGGLSGYEVNSQEWKVVVTGANGFAVDIFVHYERDGLIWHGSDIHEWWNTPFELERAELHGVPVWIPDRPEQYLTENYGVWDRPIAFYNFSFDTPNRVYRKSSHGLTYLYRTCIRSMNSGDRWLVESSVRALRDDFGIDLTDHLQRTGLLESFDLLKTIASKDFSDDRDSATD